MSTYRVDVSIAQVIMGNEVILKCDIPSFATDFVSVVSWVDSEGLTFTQNSLGNHQAFVMQILGLERKYKQILFRHICFYFLPTKVYIIVHFILHRNITSSTGNN